ncbi:chemotaxis protein CheY [Actinotalea ferrariae CF5-4]|uniref:Chemotaxis protein CheY n=1 Tax=Actinotalea ferrariae CF5-4 TaxID=948458 RepID=A0A021VR45_9CELL|nr:response regulator [Actinotalea ferrariae]EYR63598.1 chemotaxis protein CheY [Actinotalea ferrariae CF5-4]
MSRTILVVDDEPDIRELIRLSLERLGGHRVVACASGAEALGRLPEEPVDGVLLDVRMPGMDGPEVLAALRRTPAGADVPVVFLTASVLEVQMADLRALDVRGVVRKPFDPLALPAEVALAFGWAA